MLEFELPLIGGVVSNRNYSYELLVMSAECVINIPTAEIAEQVVACGNTSGLKTDKFEEFGLTAKPAKLVAAPLVDECYANLERRLFDTSMVDTYGLFVFEVIEAWIDPAVKTPCTMHHIGHGDFMLAGRRIKLKSKMR
jgi:flavin reductase (DIM6/NTAB) family NADH-FMN oxidoreductase RutF